MIEEIELSETIETDITNYANETVGRSLPSINDGFKCVSRRILYSMYKNKIYNYTKCASVVGNIIGLHPHGETSIYDALILMAQTWKSNQYPYIDIQGNKGTLNGDPQAAMRYPECKLSNFAIDVIISEMDQLSIDYKETEMMDGNYEPVYLPTKIPLLLLQGAYGIGVGFTSSIPSHNLSDVCKITKNYIYNNNITLKELTKDLYPDFTTGGILQNPKEVNTYYNNYDKCNLIVNSDKFEIKPENNEIIVHGLPPFGVNFMKIKEEIIRKKINKSDIRFDNILDINDDTMGLEDHQFKSIIKCRKNSNLVEICDSLIPIFTSSRPLQFIAEDGSRPKIITIKSILERWLDVRRSIKKRKITNAISIYNNEKHILEGLYKSHDKIDKIISICKSSNNKTEIIDRLIKTFDFTTIQAKGIGEMNLFSLTRFSKEDLKKRINTLINNINVKNKELLNIDNLIIQDINYIENKYKRNRRTLLNFQDNTDSNVFSFNKGVLLSSHNSIMLTKYNNLINNKNILNGMIYYIDENKTKHKKIVDSLKITSKFDNITVIYKDKINNIPISNIKGENIWTNLSNDKFITCIPNTDCYKELLIVDDNKIKRIQLEDILSSKKILFNNIKHVIPINKNDDKIVFFDKESNIAIINIEEIPLLKKNSSGVIFDIFSNNYFVKSYNSNNSLIIFCKNKNNTENKTYYYKINNIDKYIIKRRGKIKKVFNNSFLETTNITNLNINKNDNYIAVGDYKCFLFNSKTINRIDDQPKSFNETINNIIKF